MSSTTVPAAALDGVSVSYTAATGIWGSSTFDAVRDVTLSVETGKVLGLVGESGCGKSTLARAIVGLEPSRGQIVIDGQDVSDMHGRDSRLRRARLTGMVFQDPTSSLNPRLTIQSIIRDPLDVHGEGTPAERVARVAEMLDLVRLPASVAQRRPRELSGGQRQRVAIARALALGPRVLVADEPTSALDMSVRAQILNLLDGVRERLGIAMVFISHDIHSVRWLSERVAVMYLGRVIEDSPAEELAQDPRHPYTQALFSATPQLSGTRRERIVLSGSVPSPRNPPSGCPFRTRCWRATEECAVEFPEATVDGDRSFNCLHPIGV